MPEAVFEYYLKIPKSDIGPKGTNHAYFSDLINRLGVQKSVLVDYKINLLGETYFVRLDFIHPTLPDPRGSHAEWNFGKVCFVQVI